MSEDISNFAVVVPGVQLFSDDDVRRYKNAFRIKTVEVIKNKIILTCSKESEKFVFEEVHSISKSAFGKGRFYVESNSEVGKI